MATLTPNQVSVGSACFARSVAYYDQLAALIYIFNEILGGILTVKQIAAGSECFKAIPPGDQDAALIYLLNMWLGGDVVVTQYTITASTDGSAGCTISPSGTFQVNSGASQVFTASAGAGYNINQWLVDGNVVQSGGTTYDLSGIVADHAVEVTFSAIVPGPLIPVMTNYTLPSGIVSASTENTTFSTWLAWNAFNNAGIPGAAGWRANGQPTQWIQYQFTSASHIATSYHLAANAGASVYSWIFQGSNDGSTWVTLDSQSNVSPSTGATYSFVNTTAYSYFRWTISASNGPTATGFSSMQLYGI